MTEDRDLLFVEFFNQKLKERGLNLRQLSEMTGISMKYVESFAHGRFENLPSSPYLRGYFIRLGGILGFDGEEWWKRIREEDLAHTSGKHDRLPKNRYAVIRKRRFVAIGSVAILIVLFFGFRASQIFGSPRLSITSPEKETIETTAGYVTVIGEVRNSDEVTINGERVTVENDRFQREVPLQPGLNSIEIVASKVLGRETKAVRQVYYQTSPIELLMPEDTSIRVSTTPTSTEE